MRSTLAGRKGPRENKGMTRKAKGDGKGKG
jgi:hypothetical protein